jgi:predicted permease
VLARAEGRRHQMALRRALGASESALVRLLLAESALLVVASIVAGWLFAHWTGAALLALSPVQLPSFAAPQSDWRTLAFIAMAGTAITLLLGGVPLIAGRRAAIVQSLREDAIQSRGGGGAGGLRLILVTQVTVAVVLLVGAALLGRSLLALLAFDPGFNADGVLTFRVQMPQSVSPSSDSAPSPAVASLPALDELRALPGVERASLTTSVPLAGASAIFFVAEGMPPVDATTRPRAYVHLVTPGYFDTMGMDLVEGRDFVDADMRPDSTAVIVSDNLSRRFWPGESAIGRRLARGGGGAEAQWLTIVGVVKEANLRGIPRNPTADPDIFGPFNASLRSFAVLLRTSGDPDALVAPARATVRRALPGGAVFAEQSLRTLVDRRLARARFLSWLTGAFAAVALVLAVIGIYGTFSYWISRRRGEIAIRSVLGAARWRVLALVLGQAAALTAAGVAAGVVLARALGAVLQSLLFGVEPMDVTSFAVATLVMMLAALAASLGPAIRAARVNPAAALRGRT